MSQETVTVTSLLDQETGEGEDTEDDEGGYYRRERDLSGDTRD